MVSLPFVNYGGMLSVHDQASEELLRHSFELAKKLRLSHFELRHTARRFPELPVKHHKVSMHLKLAPDVESAWQGLRSRERNHIRKGQKSDLAVRIGGAEFIDEFYRIFARTCVIWGRRCTRANFRVHFERVSHARAHFCRGIRRSSGCRFGDLRVSESDRSAMGVFASEFRDRCPNNLMYWAMIQYAIENRFETFDFGRSSPDDGPFRFKQQLGAQPIPLHWEYGLLESQVLPDQSPRNPKFRLAVNAWKHMPLGLATRLGPHIVRCIP